MVTAPEGTTFEYMDSFMDQLVSFIADTVDEREAVISLTSPGFGGSGSVNSGFVNLILKIPMKEMLYPAADCRQISAVTK
jgi:multidrug efflux pump